MAIPAEKWEKIQNKLENLTPDELDKVADFVEFLHSKHTTKKTNKPSFEWAGSLSHLKDEFSSVELEERIQDIRADDF